MVARVRIGQPVIKGLAPRSPSPVLPCTDDAFVSGANVLRDPGFESYLSLGGGPNLGNDIPTRSTSTPGKSCPCNLMYADVTATADWECAPGSVGWVGSVAGGLYNTDDYWKVVTTDPRSGTYHAEWTKVADDPSLTPYLFKSSEPWSLDAAGFSARVQSGQVITWSVHMKAASGTPSMWISIYQSPDASGFGDVETSASYALTTSYVQYSISVAAAADTYVRPYVVANSVSAGQTIRVDDCVLAVV